MFRLSLILAGVTPAVYAAAGGSDNAAGTIKISQGNAQDLAHMYCQIYDNYKTADAFPPGTGNNIWKKPTNQPTKAEAKANCEGTKGSSATLSTWQAPTPSLEKMQGGSIGCTFTEAADQATGAQRCHASTTVTAAQIQQWFDWACAATGGSAEVAGASKWKRNKDDSGDISQPTGVTDMSDHDKFCDTMDVGRDGPQQVAEREIDTKNSKLSVLDSGAVVGTGLNGDGTSMVAVAGTTKCLSQKEYWVGGATAYAGADFGKYTADSVCKVQSILQPCKKNPAFAFTDEKTKRRCVAKTVTIDNAAPCTLPEFPGTEDTAKGIYTNTAGNIACATSSNTAGGARGASKTGGAPVAADKKLTHPPAPKEKASSASRGAIASGIVAMVLAATM